MLKGKYVKSPLAIGYKRLLQEIDSGQTKRHCLWTQSQPGHLWGPNPLRSGEAAHFLYGLWANSSGTWNGTDPAPKVIPTYPPSWVLAQWQLRPQVIEDLKRAKRESGSRVYQNFPDGNFTVRPSFDEVCNICSHLLHQLDCAQGQRGEKLGPGG